MTIVGYGIRCCRHPHAQAIRLIHGRFYCRQCSQ